MLTTIEVVWETGDLDIKECKTVVGSSRCTTSIRVGTITSTETEVCAAVSNTEERSNSSITTFPKDAICRSATRKHSHTTTNKILISGHTSCRSRCILNIDCAVGKCTGNNVVIVTTQSNTTIRCWVTKRSDRFRHSICKCLHATAIGCNVIDDLTTHCTLHQSLCFFQNPVGFCRLRGNVCERSTVCGIEFRDPVNPVVSTILKVKDKCSEDIGNVMDAIDTTVNDYSTSMCLNKCVSILLTSRRRTYVNCDCVWGDSSNCSRCAICRIALTRIVISYLITIKGAGETNRVRSDRDSVASGQTMSRREGQSHVTICCIICCSGRSQLLTTITTTVDIQWRILCYTSRNCLLCNPTNVCINGISTVSKDLLFGVCLVSGSIDTIGIISRNVVSTKSISHGNGSNVSDQFHDRDSCFPVIFNVLQRIILWLNVEICSIPSSFITVVIQVMDKSIEDILNIICAVDRTTLDLKLCILRHVIHCLDCLMCNQINVCLNSIGSILITIPVRNVILRISFIIDCDGSISVCTASSKQRCVVIILCPCRSA